MLQIRTLKHISTSRTIPSFRSSFVGRQGVPQVWADQGRIALGYSQVLTQEAHRKWRNGLWNLHR